MAMINNEETVRKIKLIVLGDSGVGKTSIINYFNEQKFKPLERATLGATFLSTRYALSTGQTINFDIWDTAGQEKYRSIAPIYYKDSNIAVCVFDVTCLNSYKTIKGWVKQLKEKGPKNVVIAIAANKTDLLDYCLDLTQITSYANSESAILKFVSAKSGDGINALFDSVGVQAIRYINPQKAILQNRRLSKQFRKKGNINKKFNCC